MSIISLVTSLATQGQRMAKQEVLKNVHTAKENRTKKRDAQKALELYGDYRVNDWHGTGEQDKIRTIMEGVGLDAGLVDEFVPHDAGGGVKLSLDSEAGQQNMKIADQIERKLENLVEKFDDEDAEVQSKLKLSVSDYQNAQTEANEAQKKEAQARKSIGQAWSQV